MKTRRILKPTILILAVAGMITAAQPCRAGIFTGADTNPETGNNVSGMADFEISGNTLTLVLTNTTAGGTTIRGDIMTGIVFNVDGVNPTLTLTNATLTDGTDLKFTNKTTSSATNPVLSTFSTTLGASPIAEFGLAVTGFSGAFQNPPGGAGGKNGIVADGTFPAPPGAGTSNSFNTAFPLYQNSLTFTFSIIGNLTIDQISDVDFLFGTDGTGVIPGTSVTSVPEPTTLASAGLASLVGGIGLLRRRRHARS